MRLTNLLSSLCFVTLPAFTKTISFDTRYDNPRTPLTAVTCSDGPNGLITKGYTNFGSLENFPNIGGAAVVADWNSRSCGTCWALSHNGSSIFVFVIDHADDGFNISEDAMNELTGGQAKQLGRINATVTRAAASLCHSQGKCDVLSLLLSIN